MQPDIQLSFSLALARDIGLEQAVLWQQLQHWHLLQGQARLQLRPEQLLQGLPFTFDDLQDCLDTLASLGKLHYQLQHNRLSIQLLNKDNDGLAVINLPAKSAPSASTKVTSMAQQAKEMLNAARKRNQSGKAAWELNHPPAEAASSQVANELTTEGEIDLSIHDQWQPNEQCLNMLQQQQIPLSFVEQQRPGFILWHAERHNKGPFNSSFMGWVKNNWLRHQQGQAHELPKAANGSSDPRNAKQRLREQLNDIHNTDW